MAIPCTSVLSERVLSKAGEVVTKKQSSIKPAKADQNKEFFL
jgi:hAT family C-terminal dimerisation region